MLIQFFRFSCCLLLWFPSLVLAQDTTKVANIDSLLLLNESRVVRFTQIGEKNTEKAILNVTILGSDQQEFIAGATVLLRRDKDKMHGKVSGQRGKCTFQVAPADYTVRVQMTGLKSLEKQGYLLERGKVYQMDIVMMKS
jgi:hypothetical protein